MNQENDNPIAAAELRQQAEEVARRKPYPVAANLAPAEAQLTIHELRVHQIELEMQNEELRLAQLRLEVLQARYFDLYDLAPVGYFSLSREGLILETNLTAVTLLGGTRTALVRQPITRFILKEDQDVYYLHRKRLFETGELSECELRMARANGTTFWAHLTTTLAQEPSPLSEPGHDFVPVCRIVLSDISERKLAEEKTAQLQARLQQAQKLETLGVLAGGVAHDFNNLLAAIMGNADLGSLSVEPDSKVAQCFATIEKAAMRAADLTRQLLAYAGKGKHVVTEVDLDLVAKEVLQVFSASIPESVTLSCELADRLPFVSGDPTQLFQIVMNLVTNACEAFPDGAAGVLTLRTRAESVDQAALASGNWVLPMKPGNYATLEVADTGVGMKPELLALIFDPFYSTKFAGRGLGLAAVIGIIGSQGGGLCVQSELGRGSSFKIYLPAILGPRSIPDSEPLPTWRGEGRILVVDDEAVVRNTARQMAERLGFSVLEAGDGLEAVKLFRYYHADLAMVLLDLTMPRMSGLETFRQLRAIDGNVPVVLSSGYDVQDTELLLEGLTGFLYKPYRLAEFQGLLRRTLTQRVRAST